MKTLTRQDILDKVWDHFIIKRRAFSIDKKDGKCKYRSKGKAGGARCGIGCLFPDSLYNPNMEGLPVINKMVRKIMREIGINTRDKKNMSFLSDIQLAHDGAAKYPNPRHLFKESLRIFADQYELTIPSRRKVKS